VTDEQYNAIVGDRLERDDFIVDDDGSGYVDNGVDEWEEGRDEEEQSEDEDDFDGEDEELRKGVWSCHKLVRADEPCSSEDQAEQAKGESQSCHCESKTKALLFRLCSSGYSIYIKVSTCSIRHQRGRLYGFAPFLCNLRAHLFIPAEAEIVP
jgi:hypothetical protein